MLLPNSDLSKEQTHHPREFLDYKYTYPVISRRSGGVSIGINLNLDQYCNFDCPYCQVDRSIPKPRRPISVPEIRRELEKLLQSFDPQGICRLDRFSSLPDSAKKLKDMALSGDGEPTMAPEFPQVCEMLEDLQSSLPALDFKLILITNSTLLDKPKNQSGIDSLLAKNGEVWAKLDAGTEAWYQKINVSKISLDKIQANLKSLGARHPYKIQSLFCAMDGEAPSHLELDAYTRRLSELKSSGSRILEVQLHTLARKPASSACTPVAKEFLQDLSNRIGSEIGLSSKIYGVED